VEKFRKLIKHDWLKESLAGKKIAKVLEICAGFGIGGLALSKVLKEHGFSVELTLTDIREDALRAGKSWGESEIGVNVRAVSIDAREVYRLGVSFDLCLMYGFSAPHFSPWDMAKVLASICEVLVDDGILVMEEGDRVYSILYLAGYKDFLVESFDDESLVASFHAGYSFKRGTFIRLYKDLNSPEKHVRLETYFWNLAELGTLSWLFFNDVDFIPTDSRRNGFILAKGPRRKISASELNRFPKFLR